MSFRSASVWTAVALASSLSGGGQTTPASTSATVITVDVTVRDASRQTIDDLTAADFTVLDNGVLQRVDDVSFGKVPIDVTVGLDLGPGVSGSLLNRLRRAVTQLMGSLSEGDRLKLMLFNQRVNRTVDFTADASEIDRAMRAAATGAGTAVFDALRVAMTSASNSDRRQLVVFFTDGDDGSSTTSAADLIALAERTRAAVSIVVPPSQSPTRPSVTLQRLATDTGGLLLVSSSPTSDLGLSFLRALETFRSAYVLHFVPRGVDHGGFHTIAVGVNRPGATAQARRGYFGR